jgi:hypothetical protein
LSERMGSRSPMNAMGRMRFLPDPGGVCGWQAENGDQKWLQSFVGGLIAGIGVERTKIGPQILEWVGSVGATPGFRPYVKLPQNLWIFLHASSSKALDAA